MQLSRAALVVLALALCLHAPVAGGADYSTLPSIDVERDAGAIETVAQTSQRANTIRNNLARITMPPGFRISLYAVVPAARHMAVGPRTGMVFVGTRGDSVWAVIDEDRDGRADTVERFAPTIRMRIPNGPCFSPHGDLFLAELNRVLVFPSAEDFRTLESYSAFAVVPEGELIPESEESRGHSARVCHIGPDGKLYISLGQPYNVSPPYKVSFYESIGIGGIIRMDPNGANREVYAVGLRNSVGMDFHPASGELWFTDNQVDGMGDDIPPGEINRSTAPGQNFGFPWFGGGSTRTDQYKDAKLPAGLVPPAVEMAAHAADLGMIFYRGTMFPATYRGGIFSAQHGSWDRSEPIGARVMFTPVASDGTAGEPIVFAEGWLDAASGEYLGRPVDVAELPDGSILVSDDRAGAVYRIWYEGA